MAARALNGTKTSVERVITTRSWVVARYHLTRRATSTATPFSGMMFAGIPPEIMPSVARVDDDR
jgi:hypothetical protein